MYGIPVKEFDEYKQGKKPKGNYRTEIFGGPMANWPRAEEFFLRQ